MMSLESISKRRICALCTIMAYAILSLLPIGVAAQVVGDASALTPGLHKLKLQRADEPAIRYAISIPGNYSPSTPVLRLMIIDLCGLLDWQVGRLLSLRIRPV